MSTEIKLQQILGTDKRNPSFTICRGTDTGYLHVYYGGDLFEKLPEDKNDPQYKMMVARLYNAGVNAVKLKESFGADHKTMKSWGDALKSGDPERLIRVLAGRQARRKLTPEIRAFVRMRFPVIYREYPSSYSKQIRAEIADVYGADLCSETLRPLLKELKQKIKEASGGKNEIGSHLHPSSGRTVKDFRHKLGIDTERVLSFVLDRGIFGGEIFMILLRTSIYT